MKRRTVANVGQFPNLSEVTLKQIAGELIMARKKHPHTGPHLQLLESYTAELREAMVAFQRRVPRVYAGHIQVLAATCAAMAIRIIEEGVEGSDYRGNNLPLGDRNANS